MKNQLFKLITWINKSAVVFASVLFLISNVSVAEQAKQVFTVETLNSLNQIHDLIVAPNGEHIVYGIKKGTSSSDNHLYLQTIKTGVVKQLTSHEMSEGNVAFSQDSNRLFFLSSRNGSSQIWQLSLAGGEATQVTDFPIDIDGFVLSQSGKKLALAITVKPGCKSFQCTVDARVQDAKKKYQVRAYNQLMVRHWDTWNTEYKSHLFVADVTDELPIKTAIDLIPNWTSDIAGISEVTIHPDDSHLVFAAKQPAKDTAWTTNFDLFDVNLADNTLENITQENSAWDAKPVYSNDGRYLAYAAMSVAGYESDKFSVVVKDNNTGQVKMIAQKWDRSVSELIFADDNRTLYVTAQDVGQKSIFEVHPEFGDVRSIYSDGTTSNLSAVGEHLFFTRHSLNSPSDIFMINRDGYGLKQLTQVNKVNLENTTFAEFEQFSFKGWNNEEVFGYWLKPVNYQAGQKYPIAFLVHGGPQGSFGNMFHYRWNAQLWAAQGYGVVMVDFHGSTGYGQAFTDSISGDWGGKPLEDLQKGLDYIVEEQQWLDRDRSCALGASYGGYMMNWISGHWPEEFKCIVNHDGLFDMPSFYQSTEELWFPEHDFGGPLWESKDEYAKFNPSDHVKNWQTPMLVIHGELDYRVPYTQSLGAFTALQRQGIESRLLMFPTEDHHIKKPDNLIIWYQEVFKWLDKYTQAAPLSE